ncbi:MAG: hypothetical protein O2890_14790 [Cyanobacteria bacterium]|nr:hypothetical protein [Cyanobacteriota bacterium]MDA0867637.1 hypothetical protein [Cyanobacteriota bacterium]
MTTPSVNELRLKIYRACGVFHYSGSYRPRKLRKLCEAARGLDLRKKADAILLAQRLNLLPQSNVIHVDFVQAAA